MTITPKQPEPIEIAELPPVLSRPEAKPLPIPTEKQIVETEQAQSGKDDPTTKYLSDRTQTVEKEMRAKSVDDFRKKQGTGSKAQTPKGPGSIPPTGKPQDATSLSETEVADGAGAAPPNQDSGVKRDWKTLSLRDLSVGGDGAPTAASDDHLSDVGEGDRTILSTREFRYFSYYHRIKELLRQYWKPNVERKLYKLWEKGKSVGDDEVTTKLLVLLNDEGKIEKISRVATCGIGELDDAAVEAFQKAAPFPNPPRGIVDNDGFVRIRWDFILKTETAPRIQFQSIGNVPP